jgi:hypothetical protein
MEHMRNAIALEHVGKALCAGHFAIVAEQHFSSFSLSRSGRGVAHAVGVRVRASGLRERQALT